MVHTGGWTDIGSGMLRGDAAWSTIFVSLSFSLPLIRCSLPRFRLSSFICRPLIPFRAAVLRPLLTTSRRRSPVFARERSCSFSLSVTIPLSLSLFFSSSRRTRSLEGSELADGHYGGYSAGFSRLSKAHKRVCPPRVKELPREQVHLLLCLSSPLFFHLAVLSFPVSLSLVLSSHPLATRPMPPPVFVP